MRHKLIAAAIEEYEEGVALKDYRENHEELLKSIDDYIGAEPALDNLLKMHDAVTDVMEKTAAMEGLTPQQFRMVRTSVRGIVQVRRLSATTLESYDNVDNKKLQQIALEEQKGFLAKLWDGIKAFFKGIVDFFKKLLGIKTSEQKQQEARMDKTISDTRRANRESYQKSVDEFNKNIDAIFQSTMDSIDAENERIKKGFAQMNAAAAAAKKGTTTQSVKTKEGKTLKEKLREGRKDAVDAVIKEPGKQSTKETAAAVQAHLKAQREVSAILDEALKKNEIVISFPGLAAIAPYEMGVRGEAMQTITHKDVQRAMTAMLEGMKYVNEFNEKFEIMDLEELTENFQALPSLVEKHLKDKDADKRNAFLEDTFQSNKGGARGQFLDDSTRFKGAAVEASITFHAGYRKDDEEMPFTLSMVRSSRHDAPKAVQLEDNFEEAVNVLQNSIELIWKQVEIARKDSERIATITGKVNVDRVQKEVDKVFADYEKANGKPGGSGFAGIVRMAFKSIVRGTRSTASNYSNMLAIHSQLVDVLKQLRANVDGVAVAHLGEMSAGSFAAALNDKNVKSVTV